MNDAPTADDEILTGASRAVGNTSLVVDDPSDGAPDPAGPQKTVTGDILAGDTDVDGPALGVRAETVSTIDGGQAILEADGDFTYRPPQGCTGGSTDAFEYTLEDNHPSAELTSEGKVTIPVAECVWYVDDSAAAGGDGRSHAPYNTLTDLDGGSDEDASGHRLFLYDGTYSGPLPLETNQSLFSEKHGLVLPDGGTGTVTLEPADGTGTAAPGRLAARERQQRAGPRPGDYGQLERVRAVGLVGRDRQRQQRRPPAASTTRRAAPSASPGPATR